MASVKGQTLDATYQDLGAMTEEEGLASVLLFVWIPVFTGMTGLGITEKIPAGVPKGSRLGFTRL